MRAINWIRERGVMIFAILVVIYTLLPIAVIIAFSFNDPAGKFNFTWQGFTTDYWANAFDIADLNSAMLRSLELAALATIISTILGTMIALALVRHQFRGRRAANLLIVIPMTSPEVVIGAAPKM
jgi:spermidine/putrescine transport system permease protein